MSKQTALQLFIEQLEEKGDIRETQAIRIIQINIDTSEYLNLKRQALQMEREQIIQAHGTKNDYSYSLLDPIIISGEQYYQETYGGQDE